MGEIEGLNHHNESGNIGQKMTQMLQSLKHRGPDSTGYAIYGTPGRNEFVMRFKVAEQEDMAKGFDIQDEVKRRRAKVEERLATLGVQIIDKVWNYASFGWLVHGGCRQWYATSVIFLCIWNRFGSRNGRRDSCV